MRRFIISSLAMMLSAAAVACSNDSANGTDNTATADAANEAAAKAAKAAYLAGINSNNVDQFLSTVTDDVVFVAPNTPALVGKAAVSAWVREYLAAYQTVWQKKSEEFVVVGDLAYERYSYKSVDTPRASGPAAGAGVYTDTGNGINIYRRGTNGKWLLARDSWASSNPAAK